MLSFVDQDNRRTPIAESLLHRVSEFGAATGCCVGNTLRHITSSEIRGSRDLPVYQWLGHGHQKPAEIVLPEETATLRRHDFDADEWKATRISG